MYCTVKLILDSRREKRDGTYPIKIRVVANRKTIDFPTGHTIEKKYWDNSRQAIKSSWKGHSMRLTNLLEKKKNQLRDEINELIDKDQLPSNITARSLKGILEKKSNKTYTLAFTKELILNYRKSNKTGTANYYRDVSSVITRFEKSKIPKAYDFLLESLDYSWLKDFESWYFRINTKESAANGLAAYMRGIRAIVNRARKEKLLPFEHNPFFHYKIKKKATKKRVISKDDLEKLRAAKPKTGWEERAIDYFFASYYLWGISFMDLAYLKLENIQNQRVIYSRKKTGKTYSIGVIPKLAEIISKYSKGKSENDFLFDVLRNDMSEDQKYRSCENALKRFNQALKRISERYEIKPHITSYWSRHTFATTLKNAGVETAKIKEMLGHSSEQVTQVYLDSFDEASLDKINKEVIGLDS